MKKITMLATKPDCLLGLNARIIYSHLVYRGRFDKGTTRKEIAAAWRLNRTRDVNAAISEMDSHRLIARKGNRLFANEPPTGWFATKKKSQKKWQDGIAGFPLPLRSAECKLTLRPWVAYWFVCHQTKMPKSKAYSYKYLSIALACADNPKDDDAPEECPKKSREYTRARSAVKKLVALGLVEQKFYHAKMFRLRVVGQVPDAWMVANNPPLKAGGSTVSPEPHRTMQASDDFEANAEIPAILDGSMPIWMGAILTEFRQQGVKPEFLQTLRKRMTAADQLDTDQLEKGIPPVGYAMKLYREAKAENRTEPHCAFLYHHKLKELLEREAIRSLEAQKARENAAARSAEFRQQVIQTYADAKTTPLVRGANGDQYIACMCSFRYRGINDPPLDKWLNRYGEQAIREYLATRRFDPNEKFDRQLPSWEAESDLDRITKDVG